MKSKCLLTFVILVLFSQINIYGQTACSKVIHQLKDEYTGELSIISDMVPIINASAKNLLNELIDKNDKVADWIVSVGFMVIDEKPFFAIKHLSYNTHSTTYVNEVYIKFTDETVLNFSNCIKTGRTQDDAYTSYVLSLFSFSETDLNTLKDKTISRIKVTYSYNPREPITDKEIVDKKSLKIKNIASCFQSELYKIDQAKLNDKKQTVENISEVECKYEINKIDDFTKDKDILTKPSVIYEYNRFGDPDSYMNICGSNKNGTKGLKFFMVIPLKGKTYTELATIGTKIGFNKIDILLENDEFISLEEGPMIEMKPNSTEIISSKLFTIKDTTIWRKLKSIPIKKIRLLDYTDKEIITQDINYKHTKSIMRVIKCVDILEETKPK